jgi:hypothetical protein
MNFIQTSVLGALALLSLSAARPARAATIDFEAEAAGKGGNFTGISDSPLTIGLATFTGGELLNAEAGLDADQTGVYATDAFFGPGDANPLVITFASPVQGVSVSVLNGDDTRSYTVSDDLGHSMAQSLASAGGLGTFVFSFPGDQVRTIQISSTNAEAWDFAIDNVSFSQADSVPEPKSLILCGAGLVLLLAIRRWFRFKLRPMPHVADE